MDVEGGLQHAEEGNGTTPAGGEDITVDAFVPVAQVIDCIHEFGAGVEVTSHIGVISSVEWNRTLDLGTIGDTRRRLEGCVRSDISAKRLKGC